MLKTTLLILVTLGLAIVGGAWSVRLALDATHPIGSLTVGQWTAFPEAGAPDADPYSRAHFARQGRLSLGQAEGVTFVARRDDSGRQLDRDCSYRVEGSPPPARLWTIHASDLERNVLPGIGRVQPALHSGSLLRASASGSFTIAISRHPSPGNWMPVSGSGRMILVLTLFDSPISSDSGLTNIELPHIVRTLCDV